MQGETCKEGIAIAGPIMFIILCQYVCMYSLYACMQLYYVYYVRTYMYACLNVLYVVLLFFQ